MAGSGLPTVVRPSRNSRGRLFYRLQIGTTSQAHSEILCQRIAFIVGGRIVAEGTPLDLRRMVAGGRPVDSINMEDVFMELTGKSIEEDEEELAASG